MQKLITLTIDVKSLQGEAKGPFTINEVDGLNDLLETGWAIEDYEFLSGEEESEKAVLLVVLNDDLAALDEEEFAYDFRSELKEGDDEEDEVFEDEDTEISEEDEEEEAAQTGSSQPVLSHRA